MARMSANRRNLIRGTLGRVRNLAKALALFGCQCAGPVALIFGGSHWRSQWHPRKRYERVPRARERSTGSMAAPALPKNSEFGLHDRWVAAATPTILWRTRSNSQFLGKAGAAIDPATSCAAGALKHGDSVTGQLA